jgi:NADPH:quinone reductase-like Zn-dependent oxidoreductase
MKAIVRDRYGSPDVLQFTDVAMPHAGDGDLLVRVRAASLNAADLDYLYGRPGVARLATGLRGPRNRGLGLDVAGHVMAIGRAVTGFQPGDEVYGDMTAFGYGAFAEYLAAPAKAFAHKPSGMSFDDAATLPQAAVIALQGLGGRRPVRRGDKVLVNGASGNVGPFAVQIAKSLGADVTGVCSTGKMDFVRSLGADRVLDYTRVDFTRTGARYDRILDVVGQHSMTACRRALTRNGAYVMAGGSATRILQAVVFGALLSMTGTRKLGVLWWKPFRKDDVEVLERLVRQGSVTPAIDRRYSLNEVPDALRYLDGKHARGKVVITVAGPPESTAPARVQSGVRVGSEPDQL